MTTDTGPEQLIPLRVAARRIGIGLRQLYRARDRGELSVYRIGAWARVREGDVRRWLERQRCGVRCDDGLTLTLARQLIAACGGDDGIAHAAVDVAAEQYDREAVP